MNKIFPSFPKIREELPLEYKRIYSNHYILNREGLSTVTSISKKMEEWLHRTVAADVQVDNALSTLEIGGGTLNQFKFEDTTPYDIIEPFHLLYKDSIFKNKIRNFYDDIGEIPIGEKYDRIISIATFEHILNLPEVVARVCLLLKPNGKLRVSVPNEGSLLWALGWKLTTGIEFYIRHKLDYGLLMRYEHVNKANEIEKILNHFFINVRSKYFGINKSISFYRYFECSRPRIDLAKKCLNKI